MHIPSTNVAIRYIKASPSFSTNNPEKCLLSKWLFCAIFLLLKFVMPKSRSIFRRKEKLNNAKYSPYSLIPTIICTLGSIKRIQPGLMSRFMNIRMARFVTNFRCTKSFYLAGAKIHFNNEIYARINSFALTIFR